ncbi:protein-glutamine gamma-glutamyltransferase [Paenibacillus pini]|uniref:Protein-glutamine gamma-glutamyltransferase n=1 Tax=Paenibacillus pini JCM 16418 TaxID=1236976 RepID=W7YZG8_9BACL|nr:protein-glutamine gamma-glutamyltransferase [Paenibacillus pini]GAF07769.1 protein-glutamine gamma-glutamyltransferase [Paenibacillus pini JCM 16418]
MIYIGEQQSTLDPSPWPNFWKKLYSDKSNSTVAYHYESPEHLKFELRLRSAIVEAAKALNASGAEFTTFVNARCNQRLWILNQRGGFELRRGVTPAQGIRDIFMNGRLYGFECATGVVIVLYKGVLDSIKENEFNRLFADLLLYDWHYDSDLRLIDKTGVTESFPGDVMYFKNPDVRPSQIEWQGENTVKINNDLYFGHGIGIVSAEKIIYELNRHRIPGSTTSAYQMDQVIYPDFLYLSQFASGGDIVSRELLENNYHRDASIYGQIGARRYLHGETIQI